MSDDICRLTASELVRAIREGRLTAVRATEAVLKRIARLDGDIGAFSYVAGEGALQLARAADAAAARGEAFGPLHGLPVSIKDVIYTRGLPTTAGSRVFADFRPDQDAIVVQRLVGAGAIVIGKTKTPEFCHKTVTESPLYGETRNPWDLTRTTGGSSGGSAAAVAAGLAPISIGTDGGGSIRLPAGLCGVVGFKPSAGRVPQYPGFPGWDILGHTGPLARTVDDVRLIMDVIAGPDRRDPGSRAFPVLPARPLRAVRLAVAASLNGLGAEAEVEAGLALAVAAAGSLAESPTAIQPRWEDPDLLFRVIVACELATALEGPFAGRSDMVDPTLQQMIAFGQSLKGSDVIRALAWRSEFTRDVTASFEEHDLLLVPTAPVTAFPLGILGPRQIAGQKTSPYAWFSWTWPFNLTGQPSVAVPVWAGGSLPASIQVVGRLGEDDLVLRFAAALQQALGDSAGLARWPC